MNYDLAKQLKDAGFPIHDWIRDYASCQCGAHSSDECMPTLSELIDACGDRFDMLENTKDGWRAISSETVPRAFWSKDKDQAVAELWLALNEK